MRIYFNNRPKFMPMRFAMSDPLGSFYRRSPQQEEK